MAKYPKGVKKDILSTFEHFCKKDPKRTQKGRFEEIASSEKKRKDVKRTPKGRKKDIKESKRT